MITFDGTFQGCPTPERPHPRRSGAPPSRRPCSTTRIDVRNSPCVPNADEVLMVSKQTLLGETMAFLADDLVTDFDVVERVTVLTDRCVSILGVSAGSNVQSIPVGACPTDAPMLRRGRGVEPVPNRTHRNRCRAREVRCESSLWRAAGPRMEQQPANHRRCDGDRERHPEFGVAETNLDVRHCATKGSLRDESRLGRWGRATYR